MTNPGEGYAGMFITFVDDIELEELQRTLSSRQPYRIRASQ